ncbi:MAG: hypothetical protein ACJ72N_00150 [Labedaea sp.]
MRSRGDGGGSGGGSTRSFPALGFDPAQGNQDAVQAVLLQLAAASEAIVETLPRLEEACKIADDADWGGSAAEEFSDHGDDLPLGLGTGAEALTTVSDALSGWFSTLSANQAQADTLEAEAKRLKDQVERAETELNAVRDCTKPDFQPRYQAYAAATEALDRVVEQARKLKAKHLRAANETADKIRSASDDAFTVERDTWYVQGFDGLAKTADGVSLVTGTIAAGLAATGFGLPAAAVLEAASTATGAAGSLAALGQQLSGSRNAPGWLAVGIGLGTSLVPGGGTAAAGIRGATKVAAKRGSKQAVKAAGKDIRESLTSGGVPGLVGDLRQIKDKGLREKIEKDLAKTGKENAKKLGLNPRKLSADEIQALGLRAKQAKAYADLVGKGQDILDQAGLELTPEQKRALKVLQLGLNPTDAQLDQTVESVAKDAVQGKGV